MLALFIVVPATPLLAQLESGTVTGRVTDATGAVIPHAAITLVNTGTNLTLQDTSNGQGLFSFPALNPGTYKITAKHKGFEQSVITVEVSVGDTAHADLALKIGSEDATIIVNSGDVYQLESQTAAADYVISKEEVNDLPLDGGNPYALAALTPGINPDATFGQGLSTERGALQTVGNANFGVNGGVNGGNEILLDGVPITVCCNGQPALTPSIAIVDQLRVITSVPPAQYGRTSGGVLNYSTVSGTNALHGQIFEFFQNTRLHAANFFSKRSNFLIYPSRPGDERLPLHYNQYGIGIGGPVVIPHLYNGKDKTFFFAGYAGTDASVGSFSTITVPTLLQRQGNISESCRTVSTTPGVPGNAVACNDPSVDPKTLIYDPASYNPSTKTRTAFPNNTLPAISPIATAYLNYFPLPNTSGTNNNFNRVLTTKRTDRQFSLRIDHQFSPRQRILLRGTYTYNHNHDPDYFGSFSGLSAQHQNIAAVVGALQDTWVLTPNTVLTMQYGFAFQRNSSIPGAYNYSSSQFGFGSGFTSIQPIAAPPALSITGYATLGGTQILHNDKYTHAIGVSTITQLHAHTLTIGFDGRHFVFNSGDLQSPNGSFGYAGTFTGGPTAPISSTQPVGQSQFQGIASFLLDLPTSGSVYVQSRTTYNQLYGAVFVQDNWRATANLTLDLGLRYDVEPGPVEKHNHFSDFDPNVTSPLSAQAGTPLTGGLAFRGIAGHSREGWAANWTQFSPRVGFAYSVHPTTVIRGAAGILYLPTSQHLYGNTNGAALVITNFLATIDNVHPVNVLSNPYPSGLQQLPDPNSGAAANVGTSVGGLLYNTPPAYIEQYHLNVQQSFARNITFSLAYAGSHGVKLPINFTPNDLNPRFYTNDPAEASAQAAALNSTVPNPFYGLSNSGNYAKSIIPLYLLLTRYPQFSAVTENYVAQGTATYNALQASLRVGWRNGGSVTVGYVWSKSLGDVNNLFTAGTSATPTPGYQNSYLPKLERSYGTTDTPHRVVISSVGRIPFGRGQTYGRHIPVWEEALLGNWQLNGVATFQSGLPLSIGETGQGSFGGSRPNLVAGATPQRRVPVRQRLGDPSLPVPDPRTGYFDPSVFSVTTAFQLGNISRLCGLCRMQGVENLNASIFKNIRFDKRYQFQIRAEMFNVFNHVQFGVPNTTFNGNSFGYITTQTNNPRSIQLGAKLLW